MAIREEASGRLVNTSREKTVASARRRLSAVKRRVRSIELQSRDVQVPDCRSGPSSAADRSVSSVPARSHAQVTADSRCLTISAKFNVSLLRNRGGPDRCTSVRGGTPRSRDFFSLTGKIVYEPRTSIESRRDTCVSPAPKEYARAPRGVGESSAPTVFPRARPRSRTKSRSRIQVPLNVASAIVIFHSVYRRGIDSSSDSTEIAAPTSNVSARLRERGRYVFQDKY